LHASDTRGDSAHHRDRGGVIIHPILFAIAILAIVAFFAGR
jgi:hypothetical protein